MRNIFLVNLLLAYLANPRNRDTAARIEREIDDERWAAGIQDAQLGTTETIDDLAMYHSQLGATLLSLSATGSNQVRAAQTFTPSQNQTTRAQRRLRKRTKQAAISRSEILADAREQGLSIYSGEVREAYIECGYKPLKKKIGARQRRRIHRAKAIVSALDSLQL